MVELLRIIVKKAVSLPTNEENIHIICIVGIADSDDG